MNNKNNLKVLALELALFLNTGLVCAACTSGNKPESNDNEVNEVVSEDNLRALAAGLPKDSYISSLGFHDGLAYVQSKSTDLCGYIDKEGKEVIPCKFKTLMPFQDGVAGGEIGEGFYLFVDHEGKTLFSKKGFYDFGFGYNDGLLSFLHDFGEDPTIGFMDTKGNVVIPQGKYNNIGPRSRGLTDFSEGLCLVDKDDKYVFIDTKGNEVIKTNYEDARCFSDGMAWVMDSNSKVGFIDKTGKLVIPCKYDEAGFFKEGHAFVAKNGKIAIIDRQGNVITPFQYDLVEVSVWAGGGGSEEGVLPTFNEGLAWVVKDGKYGYVDTKGNVVIPFRFHVDNDMQPYGGDFHNGLAKVTNLSTGKWGFIDKQGKEVIPCRFDGAWDFSEGLAVVRIGDRWGFVNTEGKSTFDF